MKAEEIREIQRLKALPEAERKRMEEVNAKIPEAVKEKVSAQTEYELSKTKPYTGRCHRIWALEYRLYHAYGYEWYSPAELRPEIYFD